MVLVLVLVLVLFKLRRCRRSGLVCSFSASASASGLHKSPIGIPSYAFAPAFWRCALPARRQRCRWGEHQEADSAAHHRG